MKKNLLFIAVTALGFSVIAEAVTSRTRLKPSNNGAVSMLSSSQLTYPQAKKSGMMEYNY